MFKLFRDAFKITNEGIILAVPLVCFMWLITLYISYSKEVVDTIPEMILSGVTVLFMSSAFSAGWFYMVKKCVEFSKKDFILDEDKASESLNLIKSFTDGIGKFFLRYVEVSLIFAGIVLLTASVLYKISIPFIREIHFSLSQMGTVINSQQDIAAFLNSLPQEQLIVLFQLNLILMIVTSVFAFMQMLWMPEVIYSERDPFIALFLSIKKLFVRFWKSIGLFAYIVFLNFIISYFSTFAFLHPIVYMFLMIMYFYFIVYVVVLIFTYYDREFNKSDKIEDTEA